MNLLTQCCGLCLLITQFILIRSQKSLKLYRERIFMWVLGVTASSVVFDILSVIFIAGQEHFSKAAVEIICKLYIVTLSWDGWTAFVYMLLDVVPRRRYSAVVMRFGLFNLLISVITFVLPIEVVYNGRNVLYTQGPSTIVVYAAAAVYSALIVLICLTRKKRINPRKRLGMILWVIFLVGAAVIQFFFKQILIISFAMSLGVLFLFILFENPESNMDKVLGCYNSYAKSLFVSSLWEESRSFSFLKVYFSPTSMIGIDESERRYALQNISRILSSQGKFYVFKENDSAFSVVSADCEALEQHTHHLWNLISRHDLLKGHTTLMFLRDPGLLKSVDDVESVFAFAMADGLVNPYTVNIIDENIARMFRVKKLLTEDPSAAELYAADAAVLDDREKRLKSLEIVDLFASEYSAVFHVNTVTGLLTPYVLNGEGVNDLGTPFKNGMQFRDAYNLFVDTLVCQDDRDEFRASCTLEIIQQQLQTHRSHSIIFRCLSHAEKEPIYCEMKFMKIGSESEALTSFVLGIANRDEAVKKEKAEALKRSQYNAVIQALSSEYASIYYADLSADLIIPYATGERVARCVGEEALRGVPFNTAVRIFVDHIVSGEDREVMSDTLTAENIRNELKDKPYFTRIYHNEIGQYCEMKCVRTDELQPVEKVVVGFAEKDAEVRDHMAQQEQLKSALKAAEVANRSKTDFLFNMSHDIRTPMNAITGFTRMAIRDIAEPEKALDYLDKTQKASDMLLSLINDILDMSRIESGHVKLNEQPSDIGRMLSDIEPMMRELANTKKIDLQFTAGSINDRFVYCDSMRAQRILVNIISNAIKYTPAEGWVKVSCAQHGKDEEARGVYVFVVEDNGIGMSEEFQAHLFEQFSREESAATGEIQGTGLGLALCKSLTELMGGNIGVISTRGIGSKFTVTLPLRILDTDTAPECGGKANDALDAAVFAGKHVLLVDDNELNREIAADILSESGLILETAENGKEAVDKVRQYPADHFDFILMDIQMPVMNGYEAAAAIRKLVPERRIPIIALSANAFEEDKQHSLESGMDDHIAKPIDLKQLYAAMIRFVH